MINNLKKYSFSVAMCALVALTFSYISVRAQLFPNFPILGGASYCDSTVNTTCVSTIPAGPADWTGKETSPWDTNYVGGQYASYPQTVKVNGVAFGAGALTVVASPVTATIPGGTPNYVLSGAQGSAFTITMVANPVGGHIQRIICDAATVGTMTVAANTTVVAQVLKNNPNAACTAGVTYAWVYNQTLLTWYRIQ